MPFPSIPETPDYDPIAALKVLRTYAWECLSYLSPLGVPTLALVALALAMLCILLVLASESMLSWASDAVPILLAVIGIIVSVRKLREEHQGLIIAIMLGAGILGTVILHVSRIREQRAHQEEVGRLQKRVETVEETNTKILTKLTTPTLSSKEAELERRKNLAEILRGEYILSHSNVSPGLLAGTEFPPEDWMNKRLRELRERWTFSVPPTSMPPISVIQSPDHGNLKERSYELSNDILGDLYLHGWREGDPRIPHLFQPIEHMKMPPNYSLQEMNDWNHRRSQRFILQYLEPAIGIRNELFDFHLQSDRLDDELRWPEGAVRRADGKLELEQGKSPSCDVSILSIEDVANQIKELASKLQ